MIKSFSGQVVFCFAILRAISAYVGENWLSQYINCCYFRLMTYSIGENQSCEAKGKIKQSQPLVGQDALIAGYRFTGGQ